MQRNDKSRNRKEYVDPLVSPQATDTFAKAHQNQGGQRRTENDRAENKPNF